MVGRVSVCLALVLAAAVVIDAMPVGSLQPAPPTAPRFAQQHAGAGAGTRMRSEAPDWWHYVAPWWSPPDHAPTKEVPDFVEEPMYAHFKDPPKDTMAVYVPYGRDAMSSFVETETTIAPARRPLYAGLDTGYGPDPVGPLPTQQRMAPYMPTVAESAAMATQPRFAEMMAPGVPQAMPPMMPAFPGVPQMADAAGAFALPASLQMPLQYTPLMQRFMAQQQPQYQQQTQQPMAPPPAGSPEAVQYALNQKAMESSEDARYAQLEDAEFGAHAKLAAAGAPVPRIWRTDRQSAQDLDEEHDFESDADAVDEADMERAAQGLNADEEDSADADAESGDAQPQFRQRLDKQQQHRTEVDETEHARRIEAAQKLRAMAAAQFNDAAPAPAAKSDEEAEAEEGAAVVDPYRFQQIGDELEAADDEELDEEDADEQENEHEQTHEEQAHEKNAADLEDEQSLFEASTEKGAETNAAGQTEEVIEEIEDASEAADNADEAMDTHTDTDSDDEAMEREADAMAAEYEHRTGLAL